jgi:dephospho-CoA kinase
MSRTPYRILREAALNEKTVAGALAENLTVIGITGPSGCGKTTALKELEAFGALVLDCDAIYHELLESNADLLQELDGAFPGTVINGKLDRKTLGRIVFADAEKLALLNKISHRYVMDETERRLRAFAMQGGLVAAIDAVELISAGMAERCDAVVGVLADEEIRVSRIMARDGIGREAALARIRAQKADSYYQTHCTHLLFNNADREGFAAACRQLYKEIYHG